MKLKKIKPWRGGLALLTLGIFFFTLSKNFNKVEVRAANGTPQEWLATIHRLQTMPPKLMNAVLKVLADEKLNIDVNRTEIETEYRSKIFYDQTAVIPLLDETRERIYEVDWASTKTGKFPGIEASQIRAFIRGKRKLYNLSAKFDERWSQDKQYFRTRLQFSEMSLNETPIQRGVVDIFEDPSEGMTKISASIIEGPADLLPEAMLQLNLLAIQDGSGYIYLRQDQSPPTQNPTIQYQFCRDPQQNWMTKESPHWDPHCDRLIDTRPWHGFSFTSIPMSYGSFLESYVKDQINLKTKRIEYRTPWVSIKNREGDDHSREQDPL